MTTHEHTIPLYAIYRKEILEFFHLSDLKIVFTFAKVELMESQLLLRSKDITSMPLERDRMFGMRLGTAISSHRSPY